MAVAKEMHTLLLPNGDAHCLNSAAAKKKNGNFIDGSESPTKKSQKQRKYVRGPYKTNKPKDSTLNR